MMEKQTAVLIPCYNEELTIAKVINDFRKVLPEAAIYVFNNNSTDRSAEIALSQGAELIPVYQQGKGFVIRDMFRLVNADCYVIVDGDDTYDAEGALKMSEYIFNDKADMVIGDRLSGAYFTENKRPFHNSGNKAVRFLINLIFNSSVHDIMTGFRAFNRRFVKSFPVMSGGFEIETEMTIHALDKRFRIIEIPIVYRDRPAGSFSKLNTLSDGIKVIKTIFALFKDYKPLVFFGIISLLLFLTGLLLFLPVFAQYIKTGLVPKFPTLIVSVSLFIMSLLSLVCGLILSTIKKYFSQLFELNLIHNDK
jgi:glycosyltransferase involved in cell wall biosynthesis